MNNDLLLEEYIYSTKDLWVDKISRYGSLNTENLENFADILNWHLISKNKVIRWSPDILERFKLYLNWQSLTRNPALYKRIPNIKPLIKSHISQF